MVSSGNRIHRGGLRPLSLSSRPNSCSTCASVWARRVVGGPRYDGRVLATDLLDIAKVERVAAHGALDARAQSQLGQFFAPVEAARLISSIFRLPRTGTLRVLALGAGSGVLTATLVSCALAERPELSIEMVAVERNPRVLPRLRATQLACDEAGGGSVHAEAVGAGFVLDSIGLVRHSRRRASSISRLRILPTGSSRS